MPATTIIDPITSPTEIVISERRVSTEFRILEIHEHITDRRVNVEIEFGPFIEETGPGDFSRIRGSGRRGFTVWEGDEYDSIRDTWNNQDLMQAVTAKLA
jgi:hypothetical protein